MTIIATRYDHTSIGTYIFVLSDAHCTIRIVADDRVLQSS